MSPTRRDFLAMIAGAAAICPHSAQAGVPADIPAKRLRATVDVLTFTDTITQQSAWIDLRIASESVSFYTRDPRTHDLDRVRTEDPAVIAFMAAAACMVERHVVNCTICSDRRYCTHPYTGEVYACPVCGHRQGGVS